MAEILELIVTFLAIWIYGTEDRPKHPIWRNTVRIIAFAGIFISAAGFLGLLGNFKFPFLLILIWGICSSIVITAEYYAGSKKVFLAAFIAYPIWLAIVIATEVL